MNKFTSSYFPFNRLAGMFAGLVLVVLGSFYFFGVSAQTEVVEKPVEQNLAPGKLAFVKHRAGLGISEKTITLSNADGTGVTSLPSLGQFSDIPAWSPDGTKLAFVASDPSTPSQRDIYSMPADGSSQFTNLTNTTTVVENNPSWSVTGKIAYERDSQIWTMNADGSGQAHFSAITQSTPTFPAWSPNGTKLAFSSSGNIWLINADGTNQVLLTLGGGSEPTWSPDGMKIAFRRGSSGIAVINVDGSNDTFLTNGSDIRPSWSSDGTKIAFRRQSGDRGIYVMDANGANQLRIFADQIVIPTPCCDTYYISPAWQPVPQVPNTISGRVTYSRLPLSGVTVNLSGTTRASTTTDSTGYYEFSNLTAGGNYIVSPSFPRHYFTPPNRTYNNLGSAQTADFEVSSICQNGKCAKNGKIAYTTGGEIYTMNPDGSGATNITNNSVSDGHPNYSPDGSNIVFTSNRNGNVDVYRMNSDGSNQVSLTTNTAVDQTPYYSHDGRSIIFVSNRDGNYEIYKMNADGSNQVRLTNTTTNEYTPAFSPDDQKIVYYNNELRKLFIMNADGSNPQQIPDSNNPDQRYERPSFSPDGSKIIFSYHPGGTNFYNIWTMNTDGTDRLSSRPGINANYSPDGANIAYVCCSSINPNPMYQLWKANSTGSGGERALTNGTSITYADTIDWQPLPAPRPTKFDFDGDSKADISVFRPSNGAWYTLRSTAGLWIPVWGLSTDVLVPEDYDGDKKTDVAVWRPSDGNFYILNSFDGTVRIENFGLSGDIPTGGDWDGDGKADPAVYREGSQSIFYYRGSMGNPNANITSVPWGITGDKPAVGDYDGDGKADAAIYRNGDWYVRRSSNGQLLSIGFGISSDKVIPADYDGDGKTDFAVYRNGIWYQMRSSQGFAVFQFGISNDVPIPADYDGDGKTDAAIYRDGAWWILNSQTSSVQTVSLGTNSDKPIPAVFVR